MAAQVLPIRRKILPLRPPERQTNLLELLWEIIDLDLSGWQFATWREVCYSTVTDGQVICDPQRRRT
jgi:hypothetical protein